jgi:nitrate/nitrite transporter NarK
VAAIAMVLWARRSDRTGERRWHATISASVLSLGLLVLAFAGANPALSLIGLAMVMIGNLSWFSVFWSIPTSFLSGAAAAGGIAMINSIGNLGGYFGPDLVGAIRQANGGDATAAFIVLSASAMICALLTFLVASQRPLKAMAERQLFTQA